ncbi:hypothetical protein ACFLZZ_00295 [Nanoarchaeota archaeon]
MVKFTSLEKRAAREMDFINGGGMFLIAGEGKRFERYYPDKRIYTFLLKRGYIKRDKGNTEEGRSKYKFTSEGNEFHERLWKKPYERSLAKWQKIMAPRVEAIRRSTRLTHEDLHTLVY